MLRVNKLNQGQDAGFRQLSASKSYCKTDEFRLTNFICGYKPYFKSNQLIIFFADTQKNCVREFIISHLIFPPWDGKLRMENVFRISYKYLLVQRTRMLKLTVISDHFQRDCFAHNIIAQTYEVIFFLKQLLLQIQRYVVRCTLFK